MCKPLVSVVMPVWNGAAFIGQAVDSCLAQTHGNLEVIIVDDGSTDNSRAVIESYGSSVIPTFKLNGGQASALNAGYNKSSGDLVIFLDADDILWPSCVSEVIRHWRPNLIKLHFNLAIIDSVGKPLGGLYLKPPLPHGDLRERLINDGTVATSQLPEMFSHARSSTRSCQCLKSIGNATRMLIY